MACCMNSIAISKPNSSPAKRVNLLMMEQAPKIDSKNSKKEVQTQTLQFQTRTCSLMIQVIGNFLDFLVQREKKRAFTHHPVHARKKSRPKSARSLAKLNMNVYISTVGSATPRISNGWPPMIECIIPQSAVDAKVWTAVRTPSAGNKIKYHVQTCILSCLWCLWYLEFSDANTIGLNRSTKEKYQCSFPVVPQMK